MVKKTFSGDGSTMAGMSPRMSVARCHKARNPKTEERERTVFSR